VFETGKASHSPRVADFSTTWATQEYFKYFSLLKLFARFKQILCMDILVARYSQHGLSKDCHAHSVCVYRVIQKKVNTLGGDSIDNYE
jgi:hypothetical protein